MGFQSVGLVAVGASASFTGDPIGEMVFCVPVVAVSPVSDPAHSQEALSAATPSKKASDLGSKLITGWREMVALPSWGIDAVKAKVDTGARTSALHVEDIEEMPGNRVRFHVVLSRGDNPRRVEAEADLVRVSRVKPSSGEKQERYVVATQMRLGPVEKEIEVSLVCRRDMLCRMLLGRTALGEDFVVDPHSRYHFGSPKRFRRKMVEKKHGSAKGKKRKKKMGAEA